MPPRVKHFAGRKMKFMGPGGEAEGLSGKAIIRSSFTCEMEASAGTERRMEMKVMVAMDDSDGSFYGLKWALDNLFIPVAATPEGWGMVFLVHVQPKLLLEYGYPVEAGGTVFSDATAAALDSANKAQEEASAAVLCRALQMCKDKLVKAETMILRGDPREMICEAAEQVHADLLVVGSRGLGPVSRAFLGSVSDYCANHAKTPVLIVKPPGGR